MNFPVGSVLFKGITPFDFYERAQQLGERRFNGYVVQTISSNFIEEGAIFFRDGQLVGCIVECLALDKTFKGREALDFFLNQTRGFGFFHCVELTRSQVDLITAFDEKILAGKVNLKDLPRLIPSAFSQKFEKEGSQKNILDAYGLGGLK